MTFKLFATVVILVTASIAAFAQVDEPDKATPTIEDVQQLVQTISGNKAKLKPIVKLVSSTSRWKKLRRRTI
jgi:type IV secretory pathway VirB2 component (pilin)